MAPARDGGAWTSSLGSTFGNAPPTPSVACAVESASASAATLPAGDSSQIGSKEDKNSMMAAFSDLGLALDASAGPNAGGASSARALLAKREFEKRREEELEAQHRARREARQAAREPAAPASALMQAIDAFAGEVSQSEAFSSTLHRKALPGAFAAGSRRARQKSEKALERSGKSVRDVKRQQRRENRRHVY